MKKVTAKQFLYSVRDEQREIEELRERIYEQRMSLTPAGIAYDRDKVQTTPRDRLSDTVASVLDYEAVLAEKLKWLEQRRIKAQKLIDRLDYSSERQILDVYFLSVRRLKLEDVAAIVGYSRSQTYRYYNSAIEHLNKMELNEIK